MKTTTTSLKGFKKMHCSLFGHRFQVSRGVTKHVKEYRCKHCKKELTIDSNGNLCELTQAFKDINDSLEHIYSKRLLKLKNSNLLASRN